LQRSTGELAIQNSLLLCGETGDAALTSIKVLFDRAVGWAGAALLQNRWLQS
jgi:hypothetical protein